MKNEEIKAAMMSGEPVEYRGDEYSHISGTITRYRDGDFHIQLELMDRSKNSIIIARPVEVKRLGAL